MSKKLSFIFLAALIVMLIFASIQLWSPIEDTYSVEFSVSELEWMKENPVITVAIDPDFAPYEFYGEKGAQGIAMEYLEYIEFQYGLKFEITHYQSWTQSLNALKSETVDMLSAVARSPQRDTYTLFSEAYTTIQNVVLVRQDQPSDFTEKDLGLMHVAVIKDYFAQDLLELHYPGIRLYMANDISDGLRALSLGQVDAFVVDSAQASYYIPRAGASNLKMNDNIELGFDLPLHFGVRKSAPQLRNILSKIILGISQDTHKQLQNQWTTDAFEPGIDTRLLIFIILLLSIILLSSILMVFWNTSLNNLVESKNKDVKEEIKKRKIVEDQLNDLMNAIPYPVSLKNYKGIYIYVNQAFTDFIGIPSLDIIGQQDTDLYAKSQHLDRTLMSGGDLDVLNSEQAFHINTLVIDYKDSQKVFEVSKLPFKMEKDLPHGILSFFVDITDLYTSQKSLKNLNEHLEDIIEDRVKEYTEKNNSLSQSLSDLQASEQALVDLNKELTLSLEVLERTQTKLVEVEKFAAMGRASTAISHEMNTPLGIAISAASFGQKLIFDILSGLQNKSLSKQTIVEKLERIEESSTLIDSSVAKLLVISSQLDMLTTKSWQGQSEKIHLGNFIQSFSKEYMDQVKAGLGVENYQVDLSVNCPEDFVYEISADALRSCLMSLIENSFIHGFVSYKEAKMISIKCFVESGFLSIVYSDNGVGAKTDDLGHILEPLFTSKRSSGSLGLGLSIVYNIVVLNAKGKLNVYNMDCGGFTVHIQLPLKSN